MEESYTPKESFKKWATSFGAGISGGNPKSPLWFCGIEFGGDEHFRDIIKREKLKNYNDNIPSWGNKYLKHVKEKCTTWPYPQKISKIALFYKNANEKLYKDYIKDKYARADGDIFLMNLFPLNFAETKHEWTENLYKFTGLPNDTAYLSWCMQYRFPILKTLAKKYKPKTLICNGKGNQEYFKLAFLEKEHLFKKGKLKTLPSGKFYESFSINKGKTHLLITPFFGQGGVMSDEDLKYIANLAKKGT